MEKLFQWEDQVIELQNEKDELANWREKRWIKKKKFRNFTFRGKRKRNKELASENKETVEES